MTELKQDVELHDEINEEIVDETLEEASAAATVAPKGKADANATSEPESIATVDKAAKAVSKSPVPKTKAGMINAMSMKLNSMKKADLMASYGKVMGEEIEIDDEAIVETIDTSAEIDKLIESEATLSDEFKSKTAVIFETAVRTKLSEEVERMEAQYKEELAEEVSSIKEDLVEKVDNYLNYVVESWMEENQLAIQNGLRAEIAETFMGKLKDLFVESYIEVPESKVDLVDELAEQVEELESKLNETTLKVIYTTEELEVYKRDTIIREHSRDLAETQVEKLKSLVESIDFEGEEQFASKVKTVKESYFAKEIIAEQSQDIDLADADQTVEVSSSMDRYVQAIRKSAPKV